MKRIANSRAVGKEVRKRRRELKLTQGELAKASGVSQRLVASLELGDARGIQLNKLLQILDVLDMKMFVEAGKSKQVRGTGQAGDGSAVETGAYEYAFAQVAAQQAPTLLGALRSGRQESDGAKQ